MKSLNIYIKEALKADELLMTAIKGNKFTKDQLMSMLGNMSMQDIKKFSDNIKKEYTDEYFVYEPNKDDFLKVSEKNNICSKIADFLMKNVCK